MKNNLIILSVIAMGVVSLNSCKKDIYGCTDQTALNASDLANVDDGSCYYSNSSNNIQIEYFQGSFTSSDNSYWYLPNNTISEGDIVILEAYLEDFGGEQYWTPLPYVSGNLSLYYDYDVNYGDVLIYTDRVDNGQNYPWANTVTFSFRMAVIKKNAIPIGVDITKLKIDELYK